MARELRFVTKHNSDLNAADFEAIGRELWQHGAGITDSDRAKTERIRRILEMPPGSVMPSDGPRKRGRPITRMGALRRELGMSRLDAWKQVRLARIPKEQFEALLDEDSKRHKETGRGLGMHGMLRLAGMLSPERPRPRERAQIEAIRAFRAAHKYLEELHRRLREAGSDEELELLARAMEQVARAGVVLAKTSHLFDDLLQDEE